MSQQPIICIALDYPDAASAWPLIDQLEPQHCALKVGKELFTSAGPDFVRELVARGFKVFLDLKFHDIPTTVHNAVRAAAELGVWMVNVHASGGRRMLEAAVAAVADVKQRPYVIAVTVLTSMTAEDLAEVGITAAPAAHVLELAKLAQTAGLDGVVCSAQEAAAIAQQCGAGFLRVTPGIRPAGAAQGDQRRIMTPPEAAALGIEVLVIGRPITQAADPVAALLEIKQSLMA